MGRALESALRSAFGPEHPPDAPKDVRGLIVRLVELLDPPIPAYDVPNLLAGPEPGQA